MAIFGKRGSGTPQGAARNSGSAVLDAPGEDHASEWSVPEPAPAGTLQRGRMVDLPEPDDSHIVEEPYQPRREVRGGFKVRVGLPRSLAGKIVAGTGAAVVLGALMIGVFAARRALLHDERFAVASASDIEITGIERLTREQVLGVFGADLERNIFKVPLAERQADLERLPWVSHATVMRLLPNRLRVTVAERVPVAFVRQGKLIGLVDAEGVLLDMPQDAAGDVRYSFPVLTGISSEDPLPTRAARMAIYTKFMKALDQGATGAKPSQSLSEVDVANPEDVKALVASGSVDILVHFGDEDYLQRYKLFEQNLPQWKTQYPKLASVDARYVDAQSEPQFVLEMQPGVGVPVSGEDKSPAAPDAAARAEAKPAPPKAVPAKVVPVKAAAAKPRAKPAVAKGGSANAKMFAALAAAHKAKASATP